VPRPGRLLTDLAEPFRLFLQDCPFASTPILSGHFNVCATTVKKAFARGLGLQRFARQWGPYTRSDTQKIKRVEPSAELTQIFNDLEADSFDGIITGEESWFQDLYESPVVFAESPGDVVPRMRKGIGVKKTMVAIFFPDKKLLISSDLPKGQQYSHSCFISEICHELKPKKRYE
jgi:hypothetical protein